MPVAACATLAQSTKGTTTSFFNRYLHTRRSGLLAGRLGPHTVPLGSAVGGHAQDDLVAVQVPAAQMPGEGAHHWASLLAWALSSRYIARKSPWWRIASAFFASDVSPSARHPSATSVR
jgi:hypothetical protein